MRSARCHEHLATFVKIGSCDCNRGGTHHENNIGTHKTKIGKGPIFTCHMGGLAQGSVYKVACKK